MQEDNHRATKKHSNGTHNISKKNHNDDVITGEYKAQMEYYFSDANLFKDKYLTTLIGKHSRQYVDIVEFLKFNKIRNIADKHDISFVKVLPLLISGILRSDKLKLNKLSDKVKRIDNFVADDKMLAEMRKRTVYVENLAPNVVMKQVNTIFKKCGSIVSIDMPTFKNAQCKGFAFVQFESLNGVDEALKLHNMVPQALCVDNKSYIKPLRVISYAEWLSYKDKFDELKFRLRNIYTDRKADKDYVYIRLKLNQPINDTTKDLVELYLKQVNVDCFYVDIVGSHDVVVKVWDYSAISSIEMQYKNNELLSFISKIEQLVDHDLKDYISKIRMKKEKIKLNMRNKKIKKKKLA